MQLKAFWPQVDARQLPITKFDPKTVIVDPKYGGLGHRGKLTFMTGSTTCSFMLLKTTKSPGFSKPTRTLQNSAGVTAERVTNTENLESTVQDRAGTAHTCATQGTLNFKKLTPNTVIMLPGKVFSGTKVPKLRFVEAFATIVTELLARTSRALMECGNDAEILQFPVGIVELRTKTASESERTEHFTG